MSLIRAPQQRFQPQGNGALNDAHPLRRHVKFAFLGSAGKHRDLTQRHTLTSGLSATLFPSVAGVGLKSDASNTFIYKALSTAELSDFTGDITLIWHGVIHGNHGASNDRLISILYGAGTGSPFAVADLFRPNNNQTQLTFGTNNGSYQSATATPFNSIYGLPITIVVSNRAGSSSVLFNVRPIGAARTVTTSSMGAASGNPRSSTANSQVTIGGIQATGTHPNATTAAALILSKAVTDAEAEWISENVWSFFSGPSRDIATSLMYAAGGANIQGGLTATLGDLTATSTGTVLVTGTAANTLDALTSSSAGTVLVTGTLGVTLGDLTSSATGTVASGPNGTLAVTLGNLTVASAGTVRVAGTLGVTLDALTATSAGTVLVTGSLGVTLGALTLQSSDNTNFTNGSTTATLGALTVNAAGTVPLLWTPQTPTAAAWTVQTPTSSTWQRAA